MKTRKAVRGLALLLSVLLLASCLPVTALAEETADGFIAPSITIGSSQAKDAEGGNGQNEAPPAGGEPSDGAPADSEQTETAPPGESSEGTPEGTSGAVPEGTSGETPKEGPGPKTDNAARGVPIYLDHVFYDSLSGNVTTFEDLGSRSNNFTYVVHDSVNGRAVTCIEKGALWERSGVTVCIPSSVTSIGELYDEGNLTFVCDENTAAARYAQGHNIPRMTFAQNQLRIDSQKFSDKVITVFYNERGLHGFPPTMPASEENCYLAAKDKNTNVVLVENSAGVERKISLDKSGSATIKASDAATLRIEKEGYTTQTFPFKDLDKETKIYLEPTGSIVIKSVSVEYKDEKGKTSYVDVFHNSYVIDRFSTAATKMTADVDWGTHGEGTLSLYQTGSRVDFSGKTLSFVLKDKFDTAEDIYLIATAKDGTELKRKMKIEAADYVLDGAELSLTGNLTITLPNSFPLIGGEPIDVDMGKFPIDVCVENGKVYAVVGFNLVDYSYKKQLTGTAKPHKNSNPEVKGLYFDIKNEISNLGKDWKNTKKLFTDKNYSKYILRHRKERSITGDVQLMGYLEGSLRPDGSLAWGDAQIIISASGKVEYSGQYSLGPVPMYWKVYLKGDGEGRLSVVSVIASIAGNSTAPFQPLGSIGIGGAIGGSTGVGAAKVLSAGGGVEGSVKVDLTFKRDVKNYKIGGKFSVFVEAKALFWEWNKKWDVFQGTWLEGNFGEKKKSSDPTLRDSDGGGSGGGLDTSGMYDPSRYQLQDMSYLDSGGAFLANSRPFAVQGSSRSGGQMTGFQENVYQYPEAQIVELDNGTRLMVWMGGAANRENPNKTAVFYSYQAPGGSWTTSAIVYDDGTADFQPVLAASGDSAWLVWQNASRAFSASELSDSESSMQAAAARMEICAARFSGTGFDAPVSLSSNEYYDYTPALALQGSEGVAYWLQSPSNNLLGTESNPRIQMARLSGGSWSPESTAYSSGNSILSLAAGFTDGPRYAGILDLDGDPNTTEDMELLVDGVRKTSDSLVDSSPTFCDGVLYWYHDGEILSESDQPMLPEDVRLSGDQFQVYSAGNGRTALVFADGEGMAAEVYGVFQDRALGTVSQPMALSDTGSETRTVPGRGFYSADGQLVLPCAVSQLLDLPEQNTGSEGVENAARPLGQTDLGLLTYQCAAKLVLENYAFDSARLVAGNNFTVYATVKNEGAAPAESLDVVLWDTPQKMPSNSKTGQRTPQVSDFRAPRPLAGGESVDVALTFTLPEDFAGTYELTVTEGTRDDDSFDSVLIHQNASDRKNLVFSDWDLMMDAEILEAAEGNYVVKGTVGNTGSSALTLPVTLYAVDPAGETETQLEVQTVTVEPLSQAVVSFTLNNLQSEFYRVAAAEQPGEINTANNSDFCTIPRVEAFSLSSCDIGASGAEALVQAAPPEGFSGAAAILAAAYDQNGRMVSVTTQEVSGGGGGYTVRLTGSGIAKVSCFLVDQDTRRPLYPALTATK